MQSNPYPLPNFFIVGAPKAGSTSLYHYLDQHPDIYMSPIKEPNYFATEIRPEIFSEDLLPRVEADLRALQEYLQGPMREKRLGGLVTEWDDYLKLFQNVKEERAIGEASVCYLWSKTAASNIHARIPGAKIIMILRDPVDRMFSEYLHAVTDGRMGISFRQHVEACLRCHDLKVHGPALELGLYSEELKRYAELFPPENIRVFLYEDYQRQQLKFLAEVFRFLGVDAGFVPDTSERHLGPRVPRSVRVGHFLKKYGVWQHASKLSSSRFRSFLKKVAIRPRGEVKVDPRDREFLQDYYRDDIRKLAGVLNRDLNSWLC